MNIQNLWIRKDREQYFLTGVIIACAIGGFVSSYWHFTDRITVRQNIKIIKKETTKPQQRKLRDLQYTPARRRVGKKQYYKLDEDTKPSVPKLGEDETD
ncbi:MAG: hypothetical protein COX65_06650 [Elusimicrobia bacterium CG_4_10_14_0_2_um_filter_56_8]|nr:MAG: hypothetical protein COX65_06650 [Elusimicrobia bacterium CG_4_10_14_0_2_um_filter_56_8]